MQHNNYNNQQDKGILFQFLAWFCLVIGWFFGLSILVFPLGIYFANKAIALRGEGHIVKGLNIVSLGFILFLMLLFLLFI